MPATLLLDYPIYSFIPICSRAAISVLSAALNALEVLDYADPFTYLFHVGNAAPEGEGSWLPEYLELPQNSIDENE